MRVSEQLWCLATGQVKPEQGCAAIPQSPATKTTSEFRFVLYWLFTSTMTSICSCSQAEKVEGGITMKGRGKGTEIDDQKVLWIWLGDQISTYILWGSRWCYRTWCIRTYHISEDLSETLYFPSNCFHLATTILAMILQPARNSISSISSKEALFQQKASFQISRVNPMPRIFNNSSNQGHNICSSTQNRYNLMYMSHACTKYRIFVDTHSKK